MIEGLVKPSIKTVNKFYKEFLKIDDLKDELDLNDIYDRGDGLSITRYKEIKNQKSDKDYYIIKFLTNNIHYIGITDENLTRNSLGINKFTNDDIYIGNWVNDYIEGSGFYIHKHKIKNIYKIDLFLGEWNKNERKCGLYFWGDYLSTSNKVSDENYDLFFGNFDDNKYHDGIYLSKITEDSNAKFYVYKGKFINYNNKLIKHGDNSVIFSLNERKYIIGNVTKDLLKNGKVYVLNDNEYTIKTIYYCDFEYDGNNTSPKEVKQIAVDEKERKTQEDTLRKMIKIIQNPDYIGILNELLTYELIGEVKEFKKNINQINIKLEEYKKTALMEFLEESN